MAGVRKKKTKPLRILLLVPDTCTMRLVVLLNVRLLSTKEICQSGNDKRSSPHRYMVLIKMSQSQFLQC